MTCKAKFYGGPLDNQVKHFQADTPPELYTVYYSSDDRPDEGMTMIRVWLYSPQLMEGDDDWSMVLDERRNEDV